MKPRDRLTGRLALVLLAFAAAFGLRAQEKAPSVGKITYKPAVAAPAVAARVVGSLTAVRGKAVLLVLTTPRGAAVAINGESRGPSNEAGVFCEEVTLNKDYTIRVSAEKFLPYEEKFTVASSEPRLVQATLTPTFGGLRIYNVPPKAELEIDGSRVSYERQEKADEVVLTDVAVGAHQVKIAHPDFVAWERGVDVVPGFEVGVTPQLVPAARMAVRSLAGVEVLVDDVRQGVTGADGTLAVPAPFQPGRHELALLKSGYVTLSKTVNLSRGENAVEEPELEPTPSYAEFVDFFNDGLGLWEAPAAWQWSKERGSMAVRGRDLGLVKNRSFRDFDFAFNVNFTNAVGVAWILRCKNPKNYYLFQLSVKDRLLRTFVVENGRVSAKEPSNILVDPSAKTSYQVRGEVQGDRIRHYLKNNTTGDEELMGLLVDRTFRYGTVGLSTTSTEEYVVEDFVVRPHAVAAAAAK